MLYLRDTDNGKAVTRESDGWEENEEDKGGQIFWQQWEIRFGVVNTQCNLSDIL